MNGSQTVTVSRNIDGGETIAVSENDEFYLFDDSFTVDHTGDQIVASFAKDNQGPA